MTQQANKPYEEDIRFLRGCIAALDEIQKSFKEFDRWDNGIVSIDVLPMIDITQAMNIIEKHKRQWEELLMVKNKENND